jgi:hypothetical protein
MNEPLLPELRKHDSYRATAHERTCRRIHYGGKSCNLEFMEDAGYGLGADNKPTAMPHFLEKLIQNA